MEAVGSLVEKEKIIELFAIEIYFTGRGRERERERMNEQPGILQLRLR